MTDLDSPLASTTVLLAASTFLVRGLLLPAWRRSPSGERALLNRLGTALTLTRFQQVIGREPNAYRELRPEPALTPELRSFFWVMSRVYVEAFVDEDNRVYGYTLTLRRPTLMGPIKVAGARVKLGSTTWGRVWGGGWWRPELIGNPGNRNWALFEVSRGSGASWGRTWAFGDLDGAAGSYVGWHRLVWFLLLGAARKVLRRPNTGRTVGADEAMWALVADEPHAIRPVPTGYLENPEIARLRSERLVCAASVAFSDEIRIEMIDLHTQDIATLDPWDEREYWWEAPRRLVARILTWLDRR